MNKAVQWANLYGKVRFLLGQVLFCTVQYFVLHFTFSVWKLITQDFYVFKAFTKGVSNWNILDL